MNNIEQVRESISDASYVLTQVGEDAPHLTLLVMQERLKRLVDLEYALLGRLDEKSHEAPPRFDCGNCRKCREIAPGMFSLDRMLVCPECGNKRCPKSSDHALACTNSNEPGQPGSVY